MPDEAKRLIGFASPSGSDNTTFVIRLAEKLKCGRVTEVATEVLSRW